MPNRWPVQEPFRILFFYTLAGQMQKEKLYLSSSSQHRVTISRPCLSGYRLDFMQSSSSPQLATISSPCLAGYLKNALSLYLVSLFWHLLAGHVQGSAVLGCSSRRQLMLGRAGGFQRNPDFHFCLTENLSEGTGSL